MILVFVGLAEVLISSGFAKAIIQRKEPTQTELSSVFFFNIAVSIVSAALLAAAGPAIAKYYGRPILTPLAAVMSFDLIISGFGLVQNTLLTRSLDFKTQFRARVAGTLLSGVLGIGMAWYGFGVWSLVGQSLAANAATVAYYWLDRAWTPSWTFQLSALRPMFSFGSKLLISGLLDVFFRNIYVIVIGKVFSAGDLGFYTRAQQLQQLPVDNIASITDRVLFSSFASVQHDREHLRRALSKAVAALALITFPAMVGLAVVAKPLVLLALTPKWAGCIPYLRLLCVAGALYPVQMVNLSALTAQGRSDLFMKLEILKKCLVVMAVAISWKFGIEAMIYGQVIVMFISFYLNSFYSGRFLSYGFVTQVRDMLPYAGAALILGAVGLLIQSYSSANAMLMITTQVCVGTIVYVATCRLLALTAFMELWNRLLPAIGFRGAQEPAPVRGFADR
jgi:O-antigen/teichoic acid export membrane protein